MRFAVYGHREFIGDEVEDELAAYPWVAFPTTVSPRVNDWFAEHAPGARITMRLVSMPLLVDAVRGGVGLGSLPCFIGAAIDSWCGWAATSRMGPMCGS